MGLKDIVYKELGGLVIFTALSIQTPAKPQSLSDLLIPEVKAKTPPSNMANLLTQQEASAAEANTPQISDAEIKQKLKKRDPYLILKDCNGMVFIDYDKQGSWKKRYFEEVFQDNLRDKKPVLALFYTRNIKEDSYSRWEAIVFKKIYEIYGDKIKMVAVNAPATKKDVEVYREMYSYDAEADPSNPMGIFQQQKSRTEKRFPPIRGAPSIAMYSPYDYLQNETPQNNDGVMKLIDVSFSSPTSIKDMRRHLVGISRYWIEPNLFGNGKIYRLNNEGMMMD